MKLSEIIAFFIETSKLFCYLIKVVHNSNIANYSQIKHLEELFYAYFMGFNRWCCYRCYRGALTSKGQSMGWIANIVAGLVGSFIGEKS